jgi:hypothetical protein
MMMELKVTNALGDAMFIAKVSDIYVNAFMPHVTPYIKDVRMVPAGTGNSGKNFEYETTYDGNGIRYPAFVKLMDNIEL